MTDDEHIALVEAGNTFWTEFSKLVARTLDSLPKSLSIDEAIPYLQDHTSIYGSEYAKFIGKVDAVAAAEWSKGIPKVGGTYLVEYVGDWFPKGNPNNVKHEIVYVVHPEGGGALRVLSDGRFLEAKEMRGWKFAKINFSAR